MLVPHITMSLMQQNIVTQSEALEIVMKLEASLVRETGVGMNQIQSQLANLTIQLQDIKKGREHRGEIWCTQCHTKEHHKDQCPYFWNYLLSGAPNPLSHGGMPWCRICQVHRNWHKDSVFMQKMVSKPTNLYCMLCLYWGHEDKDCQAYDLL